MNDIPAKPEAVTTLSIESFELEAPSLWGGGLRDACGLGTAAALAVLVSNPWNWQLAQLRVAAIVGLGCAVIVSLIGLIAAAGRKRVFELYAHGMELPAQWPWRRPVQAKYAQLRSVTAAAEAVHVDIGSLGYRYRGKVALDAFPRALAERIARMDDGPQLRAAFERRSRVARNVSERGLPATYGLIALLFVCYLAQSAAGSPTAPTTLVRVGVGSPWLIEHGQFYRLISAAFLHFGPGHLLANSFALWRTGRRVEPVLGGARVLVLFMVAALASSLATLALPVGLFLGASGGVFGIIAARGVLEVRFWSELPVVVRSSLRTLDGNAWYADVFCGLAGALWTPHLNWVGHLSGMLAGALTAYLMLRGADLLQLMAAPTRALRGGLGALSVIFAIGLSVACAHAVRSTDADMMAMLTGRKPDRGPDVRRFVATELPKCEHASAADLVWARAALVVFVREAVETQEHKPSAAGNQRLGELRSALALASFRVGEDRAAIEQQLEALDRGQLADDRVTAYGELARFLEAERTHAGALCLACDGAEAPQLTAAGELALEVATADDHPRELFVVARRRGQVAGLLQLWLPPSAAGRLGVVSAETGPATWPADTTFALALTRPSRHRFAALHWRYTALPTAPGAGTLFARSEQRENAR